MKTLSAFLPIFAMAVTAVLLITAGETGASASLTPSPLAIPPAQTPGVALLFGAYGFLLMLRRRTLR